MNRQFRVKVNGRTFDVDVEEIGGQMTAAPLASRPVKTPPSTAVASAPQSAPVAAHAAASAAAPSGEIDGWVVCPMAGKVISIPVAMGQSVKPDTVIAVLEAMKMETAICAGAAGTVKNIATSEGTVVESGARLVRIG